MIVKINIFWGDLSGILAKTVTLDAMLPLQPMYLLDDTPKIDHFYDKTYYYWGRSVPKTVLFNYTNNITGAKLLTA